MREKLTELVNDILSYLPWGQISTATAQEVADHLIANGVTVGKPLTEHLHPLDAYEGLKGKYLVFKADTGEQIVNCFVLRPEKDTAAVEALRTYASTTDNETLAMDIYNWVGQGETAQRWIPVTERLPIARKMIDGEQYYKTVAVRIAGSEVEAIAYYDQDEKRWFGTDDFPILEKVTYWYELPEWDLP